MHPELLSGLRLSSLPRKKEINIRKRAQAAVVIGEMANAQYLGPFNIRVNS
jgi:hypothetical protein